VTINQINAALQEAVQCKEKPFGGVSVVWIGDVHQLQPLMGLLLATSSAVLKNSKDAEGRVLWTGEQWKERVTMAVLMKEQYRKEEPLALIAERFANSEQTLDDAQLLLGQVLTEEKKTGNCTLRRAPCCPGLSVLTATASSSELGDCQMAAQRGVVSVKGRR
jgi:hypothetical protein